MNFKLSFLGLFFAISSISFGFSSPIHYQKVTGQIQVTVDPATLSVGNKESDVIIVVDDSGSMDGHQQRLAQQSVILSQELGKIQNVHVGILTTSIEFNENKGQFTQPWIQSEDPQFAQKLANQIMVGTNGDSSEKPFDSLLLFLTKKNEGNNAGFWRDDASLTIIIVTDAEDQSLNAGSPLSFAYTLSQEKKNSGLPIGMHAILIPSSLSDYSSCNRDDTYQTPVVVEEVVRLFKGSIINLCAPSAEYDLGLKTIAQDILKRAPVSKMAVKVPLKYQPIVQTINVKYGTLVLKEDAQIGWTYNPSTNHISFPKNFDWTQQPAGSLLVIQFELAE